MGDNLNVILESLWQDRTSESAHLLNVKNYVSLVKKSRVPDSLQQVSIKTILKNFHRFLTFDLISNGHTNNPFANLPKQMANYLIHESKFAAFIQSKTERLCFFLQLLNPHTTEYTKIFGNVAIVAELSIFRHLLQNCPKMQKIEVGYEVWEDLFVLPRSRHVDIFQVIGAAWPNLTSLKVKVRLGFEEHSDVLLETLSRHLPNLRDLEINLSTKTLSMEGVQFLSQMTKLKFLGLELDDYNFDQKTALLLVQAVGEHPSIEKFAIVKLLGGQFDHWVQFVDVFGQLYPKKRLTLQSLCINHDLITKCPELLTFEELHIKKPSKPNDTSYANLLAAKCCPKKISIQEVASKEIHFLVERFASPSLVHLDVKSSQGPLDAFRIMAFCPNLQKLKIGSFLFEEKSIFEVRPDQFKHLQGFHPTFWEDQKPSRHMSKFFRTSLVGSRQFHRVLKVGDETALDDILWALKQERHTCLDKVENISFNYFLSCTPSRITIKKAMKLVLLLAVRSPNLKKVDLGGDMTKRPGLCWFFDLLGDLGIMLKVYETYDFNDEFNKNSEDEESDNGFEKYKMF